MPSKTYQLPQMPSRIIQPSECRCSDCPYWKADLDSISGDGDCRRYPPIPIPPNIRGEYPKVMDVDWCGEHPDSLIMVLTE